MTFEKALEMGKEYHKRTKVWPFDSLNASFRYCYCENFAAAAEAIASLKDHSGSSLIRFRARMQKDPDLSRSTLTLCLTRSHFALPSLALSWCGWIKVVKSGILSENFRSHRTNKKYVCTEKLFRRFSPSATQLL